MRLSVGVDLGGTNVRAALVDVDTTVPAAPAPAREARMAIGSDTSPRSVARRVAELVETVCRDSEAGAGAGTGTGTGTGGEAGAAPVGIGVAGMLAGDTGVVSNAPNLGWRDVDLRALVTDALGGRRRVELHNDVNAIAYGELLFGAGRGVRDLLCVFFGTGIGGGLVTDGRLVKGASHVAGEIGHVKVVTGPDARACGCGARGCIEAYAGGARLQARARDELRAGATSRAVDLAGGRIDDVHPGHLDAAARDGDPYAVRLWEEIAPLLGLVLANAVTLLNPARLILGGGMWKGTQDLRRRALEAYAARVNGPAGTACAVTDAVLGDLAGILGAAALATID